MRQNKTSESGDSNGGLVVRSGFLAGREKSPKSSLRWRSALLKDDSSKFFGNKDHRLSDGGSIWSGGIARRFVGRGNIETTKYKDKLMPTGEKKYLVRANKDDKKNEWQSSVRPTAVRSALYMPKYLKVDDTNLYLDPESEQYFEKKRLEQEACDALRYQLNELTDNKYTDCKDEYLLQALLETISGPEYQDDSLILFGFLAMPAIKKLVSRMDLFEYKIVENARGGYNFVPYFRGQSSFLNVFFNPQFHAYKLGKYAPRSLTYFTEQTFSATHNGSLTEYCLSGYNGMQPRSIDVREVGDGANKMKLVMFSDSEMHLWFDPKETYYNSETIKSSAFLKNINDFSGPNTALVVNCSTNYSRTFGHSIMVTFICDENGKIDDLMFNNSDCFDGTAQGWLMWVYPGLMMLRVGDRLSARLSAVVDAIDDDIYGKDFHEKSLSEKTIKLILDNFPEVLRCRKTQVDDDLCMRRTTIAQALSTVAIERAGGVGSLLMNESHHDYKKHILEKMSATYPSLCDQRYSKTPIEKAHLAYYDVNIFFKSSFQSLFDAADAARYRFNRAKKRPTSVGDTEAVETRLSVPPERLEAHLIKVIHRPMESVVARLLMNQMHLIGFDVDEELSDLIKMDLMVALTRGEIMLKTSIEKGVVSCSISIDTSGKTMRANKYLRSITSDEWGMVFNPLSNIMANASAAGLRACKIEPRQRKKGITIKPNECGAFVFAAQRYLNDIPNDPRMLSELDLSEDAKKLTQAPFKHNIDGDVMEFSVAIEIPLPELQSSASTEFHVMTEKDLPKLVEEQTLEMQQLWRNSTSDDASFGGMVLGVGSILASDKSSLAESGGKSLKTLWSQTQPTFWARSKNLTSCGLEARGSSSHRSPFGIC